VIFTIFAEEEYTEVAKNENFNRKSRRSSLKLRSEKKKIQTKRNLSLEIQGNETDEEKKNSNLYKE
jgi:hypothetical protein